MPTYLIVFLGGGLGAALRHGVNRLTLLLVATDFPIATLLINVTGSTAMGLLAGWFAMRGSGGQGLRLFLTTGILGGYTTFSTFSLEAALLWQRGATAAAAGYVIGSLLLSLLGVFAGLAVMRAWAG